MGEGPNSGWQRACRPTSTMRSRNSAIVEDNLPIFGARSDRHSRREGLSGGMSGGKEEKKKRGREKRRKTTAHVEVTLGSILGSSLIKSGQVGQSRAPRSSTGNGHRLKCSANKTEAEKGIGGHETVSTTEDRIGEEKRGSGKRDGKGAATAASSKQRGKHFHVEAAGKGKKNWEESFMSISKMKETRTWCQIAARDIDSFWG